METLAGGCGMRGRGDPQAYGLCSLPARFLANDMEEDVEDPKCVIFLWALGKDWHLRVADFLHQRDKLWARMGFRAMVSREICEEVRPHHRSGVGGTRLDLPPYLLRTLLTPGHGQGAVPLGLDSRAAPPARWGSEGSKGPGPPSWAPQPLATSLFPPWPAPFPQPVLPPAPPGACLIQVPFPKP